MPRPGVLSHGGGFWAVAFAFLVAIGFGTVTTPLWELYQAKDGFSTFMITVVFAVYAVGVVAALFFVGHLSDYLGRRRVVLAGLLIEIVSAVIFIASPALPVILVARIVSGVGVGMISATLTAYVAELNGVARPGAGRTRSDVVGAAANMGGFAIGAMVSGVLAQWVAAPLRTPFVVFLVLMILGAIGVALSPETVRWEGPRPAYRPQRVSLPPAAKPAFWAAAGAAFVVFAVNGLFNSVAPGFVAGTMGHPSRALAGLVAFIVFGAAALLQIVMLRVSLRRLLITGLTLLIVGLVLVTVAVWVPNLTLFLIGGFAAGGGGGLLFKGAVTTVVSIAVPAKRGEALAGLFLAAYCGLIVPVLGMGIASQYVDPRGALVVFTAVLCLVCLVASPKLVRNQR
ncbi:MFS transporter [Micromonospora sp. NPDC050397]|uniref:MFS transporter n=1 Tax=Micromonospora sp. NPDC050397 TaxID=3364279 RepID=UPI003850E7A5